MRICRKLGLYTKKAPQYVWKRYTIAYNEVNSAPYYITAQGLDVIQTYRVCSSSYTVQNGVFYLNSTTQSALHTVFQDAGDRAYLIDPDIDRTRNSANSGTTLYYMMFSQLVSSGVLRFGIVEITLEKTKGNLIDTVTSSSMDYPENGEYNGYWYVLESSESGDSGGSGGTTSAYQWNVYEMRYIDQSTSYQQWISDSAMIATRAGSQSYRIASDGTFELTGGIAYTNFISNYTYYYVSLGESGGLQTTGARIYRIEPYQYSSGGFICTVEEHYTTKAIGSHVGTTSSTTIDYPTNGEYNGYWYELVTG